VGEVNPVIVDPETGLVRLIAMRISNQEVRD
jgi:hypothetical protein